MIRPLRTRLTRGNSGFSLLELLISSLILSILLVGYMSLFQYAIKSWMSAMSRMERSSSVNGAIDIIMPDIRSALPPYSIASTMGMKGWNYGDALGFTQTGNADDLIQFHGAAWSSAEGDGTSNSNYDLVKLSYFLKRELTTDSRIVRGYQGGDASTLIPTIGTGVSSTPDFAFRVKTFNIEYMDEMGVWANSWQTSATTNLPKLIRITIKMANPSQPTDVYTSISLLRPRARGRSITQ